MIFGLRTTATIEIMRILGRYTVVLLSTTFVFM